MQKGVVRKRGGGKLSEYGKQLREKQELRSQYNLRERQFKRYMQEALQLATKGGTAAELFLQRLERRLDNVVYRAGFAQTRNQARQMVSHRHFLVNGKPLTIPSYQVQKGDVIQAHPSSEKTILMQNVKLALKKHEAPTWMILDPEAMSITIKGEPTLEEISPSVEISLILEYYSR
ncbi:MAG: 30S ribosomal protein S4 [Candidatus Yanofskybacteria bacterium]|nr:30S ribosomal protein S4 [Candidatus Yanofskybacteria bacterium]